MKETKRNTRTRMSWRGWSTIAVGQPVDLLKAQSSSKLGRKIKVPAALPLAEVKKKKKNRRDKEKEALSRLALKDEIRGRVG
jgi:hypothetical protein